MGTEQEQQPTAYILEAALLLPGDILLTCQDSLQSKAVRKATASDFSHAILYVENGSYIHSDLQGVQAANIQRLLFTSPEHVSVFRLTTPSPEQLISSCAYARTQIGMQYSVPEAVRSKLNRGGEQQALANRQFCSRLVAQAYAFGGIDLVQNPDYCCPQDIASSPLLREVHGCVRQATPKEIKFAQSDNPLERQTQMINGIFAEVRLLTKQDIQNHQQLVDLLRMQPEHDEGVVRIFEATEYLHFWKVDVEKNPWRYDQDAFMALPVPRQAKLVMAKREVEGAKETLHRFTFMQSQYQMLWRDMPLQFIAMELRLYEKLVEVCTARVSTAMFVVGNA